MDKEYSLSRKESGLFYEIADKLKEVGVNVGILLVDIMRTVGVSRRKLERNPQRLKNRH